MENLTQTNLETAISELEHALTYEKNAEKEVFFFAGISKSYEVCFEYAWKYLRQECMDQGLEVYGPKDVLKSAGRLGLINEVEKWLDFLADRNIAVHNYAGMSQSDYLQTIKGFLAEVKKLNIRPIKSKR